jgi:4-hydroxy-tetrahydrodipicolinate synthase
MTFEGAFTALVTPFNAQMQVDAAALDALVEAQIVGGIRGLVPCGTTGESPTLDHDEHLAVVARVVEKTKKRVPVIAGTGSNSTQTAIELSKRAVEVGVDAVMIVMPYYNKPSQPALVAHCNAIAAAVAKTPVVLYNIPGRTGVDLLPDAMEAICKASPNVVCTKEATGNVVRAQELVRRLGDRLTVLSGDDSLTLAMMACGAKGVISVTSNVYPREVQEVCALAQAGKWDEARKKHLALVAVHDAMFLEPNPGPVKSVLADQNKIQPLMRAPMTMPTDATRAKIRDAIAAYGKANAR